MVTRVAINGFGRIGRQILQAGINDKTIEWVGINDLTDTKTLAHLLKYDSVHGISPYPISYDDNHIIINKKAIPVFREKEPSNLPWKKLKVDVAVECTGMFTDRDGAMQHLRAGAKKVLISAPAKNPDIHIVFGVNDKDYDKKKHHIISNCSCTTNCLAPIVKVLTDVFGVKRGYMATAHGYTADQRLVDGTHKDLRRARAAAVSIIPTTTGAAKTVAEVIPELRGKLDGFAWRVPVPDGSIVNFVCELKKNTTKEDINAVFKKVAQQKYKDILQYTEEPLVSHDILHNPHSCILDALSTNVIDGNFVSVSGWYDNEWGFSCRMIDVIKILL
jgi:glyceraldehyde 3-phosphate dehydrogenase